MLSQALVSGKITLVWENYIFIGKKIMLIPCMNPVCNIVHNFYGYALLLQLLWWKWNKRYRNWSRRQHRWTSASAWCSTFFYKPSWERKPTRVATHCRTSQPASTSHSRDKAFTTTSAPRQQAHKLHFHDQNYLKNGRYLWSMSSYWGYSSKDNKTSMY